MAIDESLYEQQRRGVTNRYTQSVTSNALGRFIGQQRSNRSIADYGRQGGYQAEDINRQYARQTQDYTQSYQRGAPSLTGSYGNRGLATGGVQSGIYKRAMGNYVSDYQRQMARAQEDQSSGIGRIGQEQALNISRAREDWTNESRQFDLNAANFDSDRQMALADIETQRARDIANAAAYLTALRGQFSA